MRDIVSEPRSILILYGSQSGNSEELAEQAGKACTNHGLNASVKAMDEIQINDLTNQIPVDEVLPYELQSGLFSDYTYKQRFVYVPPTMKVGYEKNKVFINKIICQ